MTYSDEARYVLVAEGETVVCGQPCRYSAAGHASQCRYWQCRCRYRFFPCALPHVGFVPRQYDSPALCAYPQTVSTGAVGALCRYSRVVCRYPGRITLPVLTAASELLRAAPTDPMPSLHPPDC